MKFTITRNGLILGAFGLIATALVALVHALTSERIIQQEQQQLIASVNALIPASSHDNDLYDSCIQVLSPQYLGSREPQRAYRAFLNGQPTAIAMETIAPDGYNGNIKLVVGIWIQGRIAGVNVISHNETPGLGDRIERRKSNWLSQFDNTTLNGEKDSRWAVTKDGGQFDGFTGATITPRAVVKAVKNAVIFYQRNKQQLMARPADCWE